MKYVIEVTYNFIPYNMRVLFTLVDLVHVTELYYDPVRNDLLQGYA